MELAIDHIDGHLVCGIPREERCRRIGLCAPSHRSGRRRGRPETREACRLTRADRLTRTSRFQPTGARIVSTTLIPPMFYVVKPRGRPARVYLTITDAAAAIVVLGSPLAAVGVVTGRRSRRLTDRELPESARHIRARQLQASRGWATRR